MAPISGGTWSYSSNAGVWALVLANVRTASYYYIGFRSDSVSPRIQQWDGGTKGGVFRHFGAKSVVRNLSSRLAKSRLESQVTV